MRITSVELHPAGSAMVAVLSFKDPSRANPYNVKQMTGLDPDAVVPRYYGKANNSEDSFYNLTPLKRDVVMRIELNPQFGADQSYSDLRDDLYRMIASSRTGSVEIQFKNDAMVVAVVSGLVTKLEATHFEKAPEVQLTITAYDSMLKAPAPTIVPVVGLNLADVDILDLASTAPHGFDFTLSFTAAKASLTIADPTNPSWSFVVTPVGGFLNGDVLHFSSDPKTKQLYLVRGGVTIYLADVVAAGSMWPILFPGENHFSFSTVANLALTAISHYQTYWGV